MPDLFIQRAFHIDMSRLATKTKGSRIRYTAKTQESVINELLSGELLLEEVMAKHGILSKKTVIRWLKKYRLEETNRKTSLYTSSNTSI